MIEDPEPLIAAAQAALDRAKTLGASAADVVAVVSRSVGATSRLGAIEDVERAEASDLGVRVFAGHGQAMVSTNDLSAAAVARLVERAVDMARAAPEDPFAGLADPGLLVAQWPDLDLFDDATPDADALFDMALEAEDAARAAPGITNSLGASAGASASRFVLLTSSGFSGGYASSRFSVSAAVVAGEGTAMERDYDYHASRHLAELRPPGDIGRRAAPRTLQRVGGTKPETCTATVLFEPRTARSLVGHFAGAINGRSIARGSSFLKDAMDSAVFSATINIVDQPHRLRGPASRPFDAEGLATTQRFLVQDGRLTSWLLDCASARQLDLTPTGHASRGIGSPPSPSSSNLSLCAGEISQSDLLKQIDNGFFITDLIGMGVNPVTGDYSRGASGFRIRNGQIAEAVNEFTIAGNLAQMFSGLVPASDLTHDHATEAPSVAIEGMTIAGG
ncbi:MAG: TldD/PmbA family protein [Hyphomicrobiales bacterium]